MVAIYFDKIDNIVSGAGICCCCYCCSWDGQDGMVFGGIATLVFISDILRKRLIKRLHM